MNRQWRVFSGFIMLLLVIFGLFQAGSPLQLAPSSSTQRAQNGAAGFRLNQDEALLSGPIVGDPVVPDVSEPLRDIPPASSESPWIVN